MKKKLISGLLAATLAFSLAACGGSSSTAAEESAGEASSATTQETSADLTGDGFAPDVDYAVPRSGWRLRRYRMQKFLVLRLIFWHRRT